MIISQKYEALIQLGQGSMGVVYKVRHVALETVLALKVLPQHFTDNPQLVKRFYREARVLARMNHPNIVRVIDIQEDKELHSHCFVMEYVEGQTLRAYLTETGPLPLPQVIAIAKQVASALSYAHSYDPPVIHRDIKPSNIMIEEGSGRVVVMDFGIAKDMGDTEMTKAGTILGTLQYCPPEQMRNEPLDGSADVYALGMVMYEAYSGAHVFSGSDEYTVLRRVLDAEEFKLDFPPGTPASFSSLVSKAIAKDRSKRYSTMSEFLKDVEACLCELNDTKPASQGAQEVMHALELAARDDGFVASAIEDTLGSAVKSQGKKKKGRESSGRARGRSAVTKSRAQLSGRYHILEEIGRGRVGPLYKAYDRVDGQIVAFKVISPDSSVSEIERARFFRAGALWRKLSHDNVVKIYNLDLTGDQGYIVMEFVPGEELTRLIERRQSLSLEDKLRLMAQICNGIHYVHAQGVLHRDIRPSSIILTPERQVKILDSGIARKAVPEEQLTVMGEIVAGDQKYSAPEQAKGYSDYRSDVFSVGAVCCDLLTYQIPKGFDPVQRLAYMESMRPLIPPELKAILGTALREDPSLRFTDIGSMSAQLQAVLEDLIGDVQSFRSPTIPERRTHRQKIVFTLHGIRTHASWQRAFSEIAATTGWHCRLDRWNFGYFSLLRFILPKQRRTKVEWFRKTYYDEIRDKDLGLGDDVRPSIVAHSFGTYILGNALLAYDYLRFDKIILCGSILPGDFPWDLLIERGQVQGVRNEYGTRDIWTKIAGWIVKGAGPSGIFGFSCHHKRLEQQQFVYAHSEYFEKGHMKHHWIPFLNRELEEIPHAKRSIQPKETNVPWALYVFYLFLIILVLLSFVPFANIADAFLRILNILFAQAMTFFAR